MVWIIAFVYSWIIFFIFVDKSRLPNTVFGGLIAMAVGALVDLAGQRMGLYRFEGAPLSPLVTNILYAAGLLFTMGVLFFQYLSTDRRLQAANVAVFSITYLAVETLIVSGGGARYLHWHYLASLGVDLLAFTALSYVGEFIVFRKGWAINGRGGYRR